MNLKEKAEQHLGAAMDAEEYYKSLDLAVQKLNRINEREGTNHGEDYLAMLIAEQAQFSRFSAYCDEMHRARVAEKKTGTQNCAPITTHHHYSTRGILCQEVF